MAIWSRNHCDDADDEVFLCACITLFMDYEMGIDMSMRQALLFRKTPEFLIMKDAAEKQMLEKHVPRKPMVEPPPRRTMNLNLDQIKALEEYRKYNTYLSSKVYSDLKYLHN